MPYANRAQQSKFHAMEKRGQISHSTVKEFGRSTDFSQLPRRKARPTTKYQQLRKGLA